MQKPGIKRKYFNITEVLYEKLRANKFNVCGGTQSISSKTRMRQRYSLFLLLGNMIFEVLARATKQEES